MTEPPRVGLGALLALVCLALVSDANPAIAQSAPTSAPSMAARSWPDIDALLAPMSPRPEPDLFGFTTLRLAETIYDPIWREVIAQPWPAQPELDAFVMRIRALSVR